MSGRNLQADCKQHALVPLLNSGVNADPAYVQAQPVRCRVGIGVGHGTYI